ncbi:serine hydrolase [Alteraurantiacibacter buctensis]|uniref:Serine hydrolase n=1 Tax=Alteraurantiacibacter buctensis TaxID=1503981 RepID=A0A844Z0G9_9SPHN|nr:serine hydrolase [Alteraurantiacibacter buctensis]MXO72204.1 serine hydrolase [Alteraurantiacibacter buctensis]
MIRLLLAFLALLAMPLAARAQDAEVLRQRAEDVAAVIRGEKPYADVFAPVFVNAVPQGQFEALTGQLRDQLGPFEGLAQIDAGEAPGAGTIGLRFRDAIAGGPIQLEGAAPWRVAGLRLNAIRPVAVEGQTALDLVRDLPGTSSIYLARLDGSHTLIEHNADRQMAIGSTFKLYVLSALAQAVARGERRWDDVVPLTERSFPSGQMQDWPQGTPVTLQTLATMMVAISDNTATDQLMHVLGRAAVEAEVGASGHAQPEATLPMMTTRELFLLKLGPEEQLVRYAGGDMATRRAILAGLAGRELDMDQMQAVFADGPHHIGVEWFASGRDLAAIYRRMADDPVAAAILAVNPGMDRAQFGSWTSAGYKGGSEPGVLNFAWLLRDPAGAPWVLAMTWNDPAANVSEARLIALAQQVLAENAP